MVHPRVAALTAQGQSIWQDDISRAQLTSGALQRSIEEIGIRGLTSNPTIFEKAISSGDAYDDQITTLLREGKSGLELFEEIEVQDIQGACDLFRPLYDATEGGDGFCSIEVSPDAARDADATREQVRRLWNAVSRPNVMVKIPGTAEGALVIEEMLEEGKNINITLLFSINSYERVAEAYVAALEKRLEAGKPIDRVASVASFFVSRVDTAVDKLLDAKIAQASGDAERRRLEGFKGKVAIANAKLAYEKFKEIFEGPRFLPLAARGAKPQRPLWASTGTKNPAYSDVLYVESLIGPHTVNTMPSATIQAFLDHGVVERTVDRDVEEAHRIIEELAAVGIDLEAVTQQLEDEGIASFTKSFEQLLAGVEAKKSALAEMVGAR
ncbi:MAG: transaldolase [Thermomicrobiales bacterium]|jgi:transaldolase|nr:transaldolase [Thermomicrobiales bacterium]MEA2585327.1 transaldolase [Thermomicrobiales bacterium]